MKSLAYALAALLFVWTALLYVRVKAPAGFAILIPRLAAGALSPVLSLMGAVGSVLMWRAGSPLAAALNAAAATGALIAAWRTRAIRGDFAEAFGPDSERSLPPHRRPGMSVRWQRDVPFWTIPDSGGALLCDLWQPPAGVNPSGLGYIYLHGSAWYILDKDKFTRRFFRHLAAQGHTVMDVAYRLYPETDVPGMVGDAKRAIAWLKAHAAEYGIDPDHIVIGGSSAGGHLAQLAGFAPNHPALTPADLQGMDLSVRGVIACYGPSDLTVCFRHTQQHRIPGVGVTAPDMALLTGPGLRKMAVAGRLDWLMGGTPEQVPEQYALCSPVNHVHADCPPTLLIQGADDLITSAAATRELHGELRALGVPAICVIYPHTDHGFDLMLPACSPPAQGATFEIERFLAFLAGR